MKQCIFFLFLCNTILLNAKEWKSIKVYQNETGIERLSSSDWLKSDRTKKTITWQKANLYNLNNNLATEYNSISQRRDFYLWYYTIIQDKGHDVVWPKMAYYISKKLRLTEVFPYDVFSGKALKNYSYMGSETVFINSFSYLKELFHSKKTLKSEDAFQWDEKILYQEQYVWLEVIYKKIDKKTLKQIESIAKRKFLYSLMVPKAIKFQGDISDVETRYTYAISILRDYCKTKIK